MIGIPNIGLFDILLGVFFLFIVYFFAIKYKRKKIKTRLEYKWFVLGLTFKLLGGVIFVLISIYYYKGGDTFLYYEIAENLRVHLKEDFIETFRLLITPYADLPFDKYNPLLKYNYYYERSEVWNFSRMAFVINTISFGSYLLCSLFFSLISFLGLWIGYLSLSKLYPTLSRLFLIPFFMIPTALVWSSGILKDTLIVGLLGVLLYLVLNIFVFKKRIGFSVIILSVVLVLMLTIKPIVVLVFLFCLPIFGLSYVGKSIQNIVTKITIKSTLVVLSLVLLYFVNGLVFDVHSKYRIQNAVQTLKGFQTYHSMDEFVKGQNGYMLGGVIESPIEVIIKIPQAINVTFFRPYLWEVNNMPTLLGAIESLILLIIVCYLIFRIKKIFFKVFYVRNFIIFIFSFALIYSAIVGLISYNFGALSRYKIPGVWFFIISLIILYGELKSKPRTIDE